jgi:hypothetical protein
MEYDNNHFIIASQAYSLHEDVQLFHQDTSLVIRRWITLDTALIVSNSRKPFFYLFERLSYLAR